MRVTLAAGAVGLALSLVGCGGEGCEDCDHTYVGFTGVATIDPATLAENPWLSERLQGCRLDVSTYPVPIEEASCAASGIEYEPGNARWLRLTSNLGRIEVPTWEVSLGSTDTGAVPVDVFFATVAVRRNNESGRGPEVVAGQTEIRAADGACEDENDFGCLRLESCRGRPCYLEEFPEFAVLLRALPNLRVRRTARVVRSALEAAADRNGMHVQHWSIQRDHVHLIVEAKGRAALSRGMQGLKIRLAKALNRAWRRKGSGFSDRYRAHGLKTPREVRSALLYVLNNFRKHHPKRRHPVGWLDPLSTAAEFDGWKGDRRTGAPPSRARSWLLRVGWRRGGRLDPNHVPAA
jgi:REP element-mobilizing transposase RayT